MTELFMISVPDATKELDNRVKDAGEVYPLHVPSLQVGTFGSLVTLSDDLAKADSFVETNTIKVAQLLFDLTEKKHTHEENLLVSGRTPENFVTKFEWDPSKFNTKLPLKEVLQDINQKVSATEQDIKQKSAAYNKVKGELDALNRKTQGTLLTRSLDDIVTEEMFVNNSEYLITLLVVVPKSSYGSWISSYESLNEMVVPCSSEDVSEDHEYKLVTVTLFRKALDAFKVAAREKKFIVREFEFQKSEASAQAEKKDGLLQDAKRKQGVLFNWCKVSFSELFQAWIHIKVLRIFVESVLRYGLPVNFRAYVIKPHKNTRALRRILEVAYSHLDKTSAPGAQVVDIPGLAGMGLEYYPYVNVDVKLQGVLL